MDRIDQRRISAATGPGICGSKYGKAKREPVRNGVKDGMPHGAGGEADWGLNAFHTKRP